VLIERQGIAVLKELVAHLFGRQPSVPATSKQRIRQKAKVVVTGVATLDATWIAIGSQAKAKMGTGTAPGEILPNQGE
jgi:hypothetical protein